MDVLSQSLSTNAYATNEKPVQMLQRMYDTYQHITPLTSIHTKLSVDDAWNSRVDWTEKNKLPHQVTVTAAAASGDSAITIGSHYTYLRNHDMLFNPKTFEVIRVDAYATRDATVDVIRGWGTSDAAAIEAGTVLELILPSKPEASEDSDPRSVTNENFYNLTQEIELSTRTSTRVMNEKTHFGGKGTKRLENQSDLWYDWRVKFEKNVLLSVLADTADVTLTTQYIKTMEGLVSRLRNGTNYLDVNGPLTESILDSYLTKIWTGQPDSDTLACLCAPKVYGGICRMAKPLIRISPNSKKYGLQLNQYVGAKTIDLIPHPLFDGPVMGGWMFMLDFKSLKLMYQKKPVMMRDVAEHRNNYIEDKIYALATFIAANEKRHGMAVNIAA